MTNHDSHTALSRSAQELAGATSQGFRLLSLSLEHAVAGPGISDLTAEERRAFLAQTLQGLAALFAVTVGRFESLDPTVNVELLALASEAANGSVECVRDGRKELFVRLSNEGHSIDKIAEIGGLSRSRVHEILSR